MRFLVDECTGPAVAAWLRNEGHQVLSIYDELRGADDLSILELAYREKWIVVTNDKDFGEKVFRGHLAHRGVIILRLQDDRPPSKIAALNRTIEVHGKRLAGVFVVVSESQIRFGRTDSE